MKAKYDILCTTGEACPVVKNELIKIGFEEKDIKETPKSFSGDMTAVYKFEDGAEEKKLQQLKQRILDDCEGDVQHIHFEVV